MKLLITIDTEEDNWNRYSPTVNPVCNIKGIERLQKIFDKFSVKPTYLITYPVANTTDSINILKPIMEKGNCEIGAHCHPWNTPPLNDLEPVNKTDTMICNLPENMIYKKIALLHQTIKKNFGIAPTSFRTGRYGFSKEVAQTLVKLKYKVDSSITPYTNWNHKHGPDFSNKTPHFFWYGSNGKKIYRIGKLLEVPVSVGFLQSNFDLRNRFLKFAEQDIFKRIHLVGLLDYLNIVSKAWLSPEIESLDTMIKLSKQLRKNKFNCLNLTFHSSSLVEGLSPFTTTRKDVERLLEKISDFISFERRNGIESQTLSEFADEKQKSTR
ncbi:hypothetical protein [Desulfosarcina ovata]|uniref:Deacetylase n=1 Tax=Desulfosarcina ovata subsp. ovata TaxID=2752305 RepID=A0A5K8A7U6_9BACT|nr:hypothetical protein [Desulfosarcina ovata]BBO88536.1 deacetylase [Desulfosarcina ovata subsp. ovata]